MKFEEHFRNAKILEPGGCQALTKNKIVRTDTKNTTPIFRTDDSKHLTFSYKKYTFFMKLEQQVS